MTDIDFAPPPSDTEPQSDIPLFDKNEPRSLINVVWVDMVEVMERLEKVHPELFEMSERKLIRKAKPEPVHNMLRLRFWLEYERAQSSGKKMQQFAVTGGLCTREFWSRNIARDYERLAFILTPPPRYLTRMEALLYMGLDELEDILALPIRDSETGKIDTKLISEKVKIFQMLDLRVKGAVVQKIAMHSRIDQRVQNKDPLESLSLNDLEALDHRIQGVRKQIDRMQNREFILPEPKLEEDQVEVEPGV